MALRTQLVEIPWAGGLDTKSDDKLVIPGNLVRLENGVYRKAKIVTLRNGYKPLGQNILEGGVISKGTKLSVFGDELLLSDRRTVYAYAAGNDAWVTRGDVSPMVIANKDVIRNNAEQTLCDSASTSGVTLYAWEDSRGGIRATAIDDETTSIVLADTSVNTTGKAPRVLAVKDRLFIIYRVSGGTEDLRLRIFDPKAPTSLIAETTLVTDLHPTDFHFDAVRHGLIAVFVYNTAGGTTKIAFLLDDGLVGTALDGVPPITTLVLAAANFVPGDVNIGADTITITAHGLTNDSVVRVSSTVTLPGGLVAATDYFVVGATANTFQLSATLGGAAIDLTSQGSGTHTVTPQGDAGENSIAMCTEASSGDIWVFVHNNRNGLRGAVLFNDFTFRANPFTVESVTAPLAVNITAAVVGAGGSARIFWEVTAAAAVNHFVKSATATADGVVAGIAVFKRSVGLGSKSWLHDSTVYVGLTHDSTLQATFFIASEDGVLRGKVLPRIGGGLVAFPSLPQVFQTSVTGVFQWAALKRTRLVGDNAITFFLRGVSRSTLDFISANIYLSAELGENLHICGGFLGMYDRHGVVEHGFHLFPEGVTTAPTTTGGSMADGTYQYQVCYEWTDNVGQIHRSAPSIAVNAVVSGGGGNGKVTVTIPTLRLTAKTSPRAEADLVVYRTAVNAGIFHRVTSISAPVANDPTVDTVDFVDTSADASITTNEFIYTTGGVLDHVAPPAPNLIAEGKTRVFLVGEDPLEIWFSKEHASGLAVAFNDTLRKRVSPKGGDITAISVLDDQVIIFKFSSIFAFTGDGPNNTGLQGSFNKPERVSTDVGCVEPESVVTMPDGLMFKSEKGFFLINRALQVSYIGENVDAFNAEVTTSGVLVKDSDEVRFTTLAGPALVYDYRFNKWSTFTNHEGLSAVLWQGTYVYLRAAGLVYKEVPGFFRDNNVAIKLLMESAWLHLGGLEGFQRVWRALLLGRFKTDHVLKIGVGYDYEESFTGQYSFDTSQLLGAGVFGDDAFFGDDAIFGGIEDKVYQFGIHLERQKCQAVRFRIENVFSGTAGEAYEIASLALLAGMKRGAAKLRTAKTA